MPGWAWLLLGVTLGAAGLAVFLIWSLDRALRGKDGSV